MFKDFSRTNELKLRMIVQMDDYDNNRPILHTIILIILTISSNSNVTIDNELYK